jgi:hypothetical protein
MARGLGRVKKATKAFRPGNARVSTGREKNLGSRPKTVPASRQPVVDGALLTGRTDISDYTAFHLALGGRHAVLQLDQRKLIDDFEAAFAEAEPTRRAPEMFAAWPKVERLFPAALEQVASLIDRGLLVGVTLTPRMLAICGRGGHAIGDGGGEVRERVALASILHHHVEDTPASASVATPTVKLRVFRPDLDRVPLTLHGMWMRVVGTLMKGGCWALPVKATSWKQALGIWAFASRQFAGLPVPEPFAGFIAKAREVLVSAIDDDGCDGEPEDKRRADELVRDYPAILRQMQVYLDQLRAADESEEGRAAFGVWTRELLAPLKALDAVPAEAGLNEAPRQVVPARKSRSAASSGPAASRIAPQPNVALEIREVGLGLVVDPEIAALIPPPSKEELAMLESNLLRDGCLDPLLVWADGRRRVVLDGHTRLSLCQRHDLDYGIKELQFADRTVAIEWVLAHQLGRRNLTPEARAYLRGRLYNSGKAQGTRRDLTSGQSDQKSTTAGQLATQYKVGEKTVRRDAHFAEQLDRLAEVEGADLKSEVLSRGGRVGRRDVARIVALEARARRQVVDAIRSGTKASAALHAHVGAKVETGRKPQEKACGSENVAGQAQPQLDSLLHALSDGVAFLKQARLGSMDSTLHNRLFDLMQALEVQVMRHGLGPQSGE